MELLYRESIVRHAVRRPAYIGAGFLMAIIAALGFAPESIRQLLSDNLPPYLIVHFHALIYVGWLALFILQASLAAFGKIEIHKKIGSFLIFYGALMFVLGIAVTLNRYIYMVRAGDIEAARRVNLAPIVDMLAFPLFFGAAVLTRHQPELHKRLMVVTTTILLYAAIVRAGLPFFLRNYFGFMTVWASPILLAMLYDWRKLRVVHPIYLVGIATLFLLSARTHLIDCATWVGITQWFNQFLL